MCLMLDQFLWGHSSCVCDISCLVLSLFYRSPMVYFKENCNFPWFQRGSIIFSKGGQGRIGFNECVGLMVGGLGACSPRKIFGPRLSKYGFCDYFALINAFMRLLEITGSYHHHRPYGLICLSSLINLRC